MNPKSPNFKHPNFGIPELRTFRTLLLSSRPELNKLEHPKNAELRTQTQVHSNTKSEYPKIRLWVPIPPLKTIRKLIKDRARREQKK